MSLVRCFLHRRCFSFALVLWVSSVVLLGACGSSAATRGVSLTQTPAQMPVETTQPTAEKAAPSSTSASQETAVTELPTLVPSPTAVSQPPTQEPLPTTAATASGASELDACTLITPEEASAALGQAIGEPSRETYPGLYSCTYPAGDFNHVEIIVTVYDSPQDAADAFQMELDINQYEQVSGLGDRALRPEPIMDLTVDQGRYEVSMDILTSQDDPQAEYQLARDLAEKALARLP
jgi:hypothetical protein